MPSDLFSHLPLCALITNYQVNLLVVHEALVSFLFLSSQMSLFFLSFLSLASFNHDSWNRRSISDEEQHMARALIRVDVCQFYFIFGQTVKSLFNTVHHIAPHNNANWANRIEKIIVTLCILNNSVCVSDNPGTEQTGLRFVIRM
jgi:hypothetical protein